MRWIAEPARPAHIEWTAGWTSDILPPWQPDSLPRGHRRLAGSRETLLYGCTPCAPPAICGDTAGFASLSLVIGFQTSVSAERPVPVLPPLSLEWWGARPLAACLAAPSSAEMRTPGWSRTSRSPTWAGRRRGATCSTSATGRTWTVKMRSKNSRQACRA